MLLLRPLSGVLSRTLVLIVFFVIEGVASMMFALEHKRELSGRWGWMLASGIIDLHLGRYHFCRPARHRGLGYRAGGRNQYGIRRPGADRDGTACPRDRSAFDCLGALSGGARLAPRLTAMGHGLPCRRRSGMDGLPSIAEGRRPARVTRQLDPNYRTNPSGSWHGRMCQFRTSVVR